MTLKTSREALLDKMLAIIRENPGIRPSELNRRLDISHSWNLRLTLLKMGLIKKEEDGSAVYYFPQKS